jgi:hypothetical protein
MINDVSITPFDIANSVPPKLTPREKINGAKIESERGYQPLLNNIARFLFSYFSFFITVILSFIDSYFSRPRAASLLSHNLPLFMPCQTSSPHQSMPLF